MTDDRRHDKRNRRWARKIIDVTETGWPRTEDDMRKIRTLARKVRDDHTPPEPLPLKPRPALPMRGDFLKVGVKGLPRREPGHRFSDAEVRHGFLRTTLQYLALPKAGRDQMRGDALARGHTHMAVYIRSANDIKIGHFDYYNDPDHVIKCLTELVQAGIGPVVFLLDDEGRAFNQDAAKVRRAWQPNLPKWRHLCSVLVPGLECNEYWDAVTRMEAFQYLQFLAPDAYIAGHFTSDHYETHPAMDGILWQFAPWKHDADGKDTPPRRNGTDNFANEITKANKLTGHSREWASPCRQAIADGIDFIAGEWTQLPTDGESWGVLQSEAIESALLSVYGDPARVGLMNGARKR